MFRNQQVAGSSPAGGSITTSKQITYIEHREICQDDTDQQIKYRKTPHFDKLTGHRLLRPVHDLFKSAGAVPVLSIKRPGIREKSGSLRNINRRPHHHQLRDLARGGNSGSAHMNAPRRPSLAIDTRPDRTDENGRDVVHPGLRRWRLRSESVWRH
jgi:hypothetical protein